MHRSQKQKPEGQLSLCSKWRYPMTNVLLKTNHITKRDCVRAMYTNDSWSYLQIPLKQGVTMTTSSSRKTYDTSLIGPQRRGLYFRLKLHKQTGLYTTNSCWLLKTGREEDPGAYIQQGGLLLRQFQNIKLLLNKKFRSKGNHGSPK